MEYSKLIYLPQPGSEFDLLLQRACTAPPIADIKKWAWELSGDISDLTD
jgi:hypothetical protein